jgi:hypothetical protein
MHRPQRIVGRGRAQVGELLRDRFEGGDPAGEAGLAQALGVLALVGAHVQHAVHVVPFEVGHQDARDHRLDQLPFGQHDLRPGPVTRPADQGGLVGDRGDLDGLALGPGLHQVRAREQLA